jgi:hypothetical protein
VENQELAEAVNNLVEKHVALLTNYFGEPTSE